MFIFIVMYCVDEWNNFLMKIILLIIVFLILCFCIGVLGNLVVFFIYKIMDILIKGLWFFIFVLVLVDLIVVVIFLIVGIVYYILLISSIIYYWCLILVFGICWLVCVLVMIIFVILFDRYRRICYIIK